MSTNGNNYKKIKYGKYKGMTYSQKKRASMPARQEYFRHNQGLFGMIWICAYCGKPLVGRQAVEVDHIIPLANPLGQNKRWNLVAACPECNGDKSDKFDGRIVRGYIWKLVEVILFNVQKLFIICIVALWFVAWKFFDIVFSILKMPLQSTSMQTRLLCIIVYASIGYFVLNNFLN